ncbi:MAG: hypothetical protein IPK97_00725 [Ahniella sp.]|nr:hypothetical protein [Ahniella sp.]
MDNPYQPPKAELSEPPMVVTEDPGDLFRPWQTAICGLFGGPLALMYTIRSNELCLGDSRRANLTLYIGIALIGILVPITGRVSNPFLVGLEHLTITALGAVWVWRRQMARAGQLFGTELPAHSWPTLVIVILASIGASMILAWIVGIVLAATGF